VDYPVILRRVKALNRKEILLLTRRARPIHRQSAFPYTSADMAMYHIGKIPPIHFGNICSLKPLRCCSPRSVRKPKLSLRLWLSNANSPPSSLLRAVHRLNHQVLVVTPRQLRNRLDKPLYDATFARVFLRSRQVTACEKIRVRAYGGRLF